MDRHQPNVVNKESRSVFEILRDKKIATTLAVSVGIAALSGCATDREVEPKPTASSSTEETPTPSPESPEKTPTPEHVFTGAVNYEQLTDPNWDTLTNLEQQARCTEFFTANIEGETPVSPSSTGVEIASWFKNRLLVLGELAKDKTDERNYIASQNIVDCLTFKYLTSDEESPGHQSVSGMVTSLAKSNLQGDKMIYIEPEQVTRYSDGTFSASSENFPHYTAFAIEGYKNNGFGNNKGQLSMNYFQWAEIERTFRLVLTTPTEDQGVNPYFGTYKPPVVLDPSRQDAPNTPERS